MESFASTIVMCHPAPPARQAPPAPPVQVPLQVHQRSSLSPPPTSHPSHHQAPAPRQAPAQAHLVQALRQAHLRSSSPVLPTPPPPPPPPPLPPPRLNHLPA